MQKKRKNKSEDRKEKNNLTGYPQYPADEDIYSNEKEEKDLDPENPSKIKTPNEKLRKLNEKDFTDDFSGDDLDIAGFDEEPENPINEDEENSYYSLSDDLSDFEEDRED